MAGTEIFRPMRDLRSVLHQGMVGQSAAAGIHELLDAEPAGAGRRRRRVEAGAGADHRVRGRRLRLSRRRGAGPRRPVVHASPPASGSASSGPSGSGKSSIVRLLLRLHDPQAGSVTIGGQDLRTLDPEHPRRRSRWSHQDTTCSTARSRRTSASAGPTRRSAELEAAARAANAHEFITRPAAGLRDDDRRARRQAVGRPAPAPGHRARAAARRADPDPRRGAVARSMPRTRR